MVPHYRDAREEDNLVMVVQAILGAVHKDGGDKALRRVMGWLGILRDHNYLGEELPHP